jgi:phage-related protein (TIGR01555 family)
MSKSRKRRFMNDKKPSGTSAVAAQSQAQPQPQQPAPLPRGLTLDAFTNVLARMGFGTPSMLEGTEYPLTRLTKNYQLMNSLYRSHWIIRRIIDVIPEDMCKSWYELTSQLPPDQLERFRKMERKTRVRASVLEGLKWGRLYGGAGGVMMIDGHDKVLDQPLDLDAVMPGSFKGILILDRWSGLSPMSELVDDINDPDFGLPKMYQITNEALHTTLRVHHSRLVRFSGRDLPNWERQAEMYWGASEVEHVFDELKKRDNTSWNIANLVFIANLRVLQMAGMEEVLSVGTQKVKEDLYNTVQAQNWLMNNFGLYVLGPNDKFDTKQYTFSGLSDVYENFMMDVAGAAEMPVTKLFGRSPAGLNATGESDMQNYYDSIEEKQEAQLRPVLEKLLPVMCVSEYGLVPDDTDIKFNPVRRATDMEKSDLGAKRTEAVKDVFDSGMINQQIALKELRQMKESTGMWSNITDEDIAKADLSNGLGIPEGILNATPRSAAEMSPTSLPDSAVDIKSLSHYAIDGGPGSGNFGHSGRPGEVGGSGSGGGISEGNPLKSKLRVVHSEYDPNKIRVPIKIIKNDAIRDTEFTVLEDGTAAFITSRNVSRYNQNDFRRTSFRYMDDFFSPLAENEFVRMTGKKEDAEYLKRGEHQGSKNHRDDDWETVYDPESASFVRALSVSKFPEFSQKYGYYVTGKKLGVGSDGEPLLNVKKAKLKGTVLTGEKLHSDFEERLDKKINALGLTKEEYLAIRYNSYLDFD